MTLLRCVFGLISGLYAAVNEYPSSVPRHVRYVIVGAGPGGLQLAHYLESAGRDYVVIERNAGPGSFFERLPRFRQLISINKRFSGRDELDDRMRHDWNSLLSDPSHSADAGAAVSSTDSSLTLSAAQASGWLLFREYSSDYYPHADALVRYLRDWAAGSGGRRALRVRYNTSVARVQVLLAVPPSRKRCGPPPPRFRLALSDGSELTCTFLVLATGLQEPVTLTSPGATEAMARGWIKHYHNASTDLQDYAGKRVLLLGRGNAAFEFANRLIEVTAAVHVVASNAHRLRLAYETHYPGDIRAVHAHLLESYQLKSQDTVFEVAMDRLHFSWNNSTGRVSVHDGSLASDADRFGRHTLHSVFRDRLDIVISALGWRFTTALFDARGPIPMLNAKGKYPLLRDGGFESATISGLFFAGTAMHGNDHKVSSGGFIHGFRYLCRALHRQLEESEADEAAASAAAAAIEGNAGGTALPVPAPPLPAMARSWPRTPLECGLRGIVAALMRRINLSAGLFQMFGGLADVVLFAPPPPPPPAEMPLDVGPLAALYEPWSFPHPTAACAAAAERDEFAPLWHAREQPLGGHKVSATTARDEADAAIGRALHGSLFEEVPVGSVLSHVRRWARDEQTRKIAGPAVAIEWLTLTMEYGSGQKSRSLPPFSSREQLRPAHDATSGSHQQLHRRDERARDPFSRSRGNSDLRAPERSQFLHPVLRFFRMTGGDALQVSEQHIIEDATLSWTLHEPHVMALARWLQDLGTKRVMFDASRVGAIRQQAAPESVPSNHQHHPRSAPPLRALLLDWTLSLSGSMLYIRGEVVRGGSGGWFLALSVPTAANELCVTADASGCTGVDFLALHVLPEKETAANGAPPLSREEMEFTAAAYAQSTQSAPFKALDPALAPGNEPRPPGPLAEEKAAKSAAARMFELDAAYRALTAAHPGLAVAVFLTPRSGLGAAKAAFLYAGDPLSEILLVCAGSSTVAADAVAAAATASGSVTVPLFSGVALKLDAPELLGRRFVDCYDNVDGDESIASYEDLPASGCPDTVNQSATTISTSAIAAIWIDAVFRAKTDSLKA